MITSLRIENFILVKNLEINFGKGLQVLSGETGAGKSVIVGAIDFAFGGKIRPGILFDETKAAIVEVSFEIDFQNKNLLELLTEYEVDSSENEIYFSTELTPLSKRRTYLNGRRISQTTVKQFREILLDFHSQRDQQKLLNEDFQLEIIDRFGGLISERNDFQKLFLEIKEQSSLLEKLQLQEKEREEKLQLYKYQIHEIEAIKPEIGEDEKLQEEWNLLSNAQEILSEAAFIEQNIYESENSVYDVISSFVTRLSTFENSSADIAKIVSYLQESLVNLEETVSELRNLQDKVEIDDFRLQECKTRLDELNALKSKYKLNLPEISRYYEKIRQTISASQTQKEEIDKLKNELKGKAEILFAKAKELSAKRQKAAVKLEKEIGNNIKKLAIPDGEIKIKFDKVTAKKVLTSYSQDLSESGQDKVKFFFSANRGVKLQPLSVAASGGEISRVLLAIKKILSDKVESETVIFDEIDSGIGGETANFLGEFIYRIGRFHQIICITHLAQIASLADENFVIEKINDKNTAKIIVKKLPENEKKLEIARMLSGSKSALAVKHAEEIIKKNLRRIDD